MVDEQPSWLEGFLGQYENAPWPAGTLATAGRLGLGAIRGMGDDVAQQEREFTLARNSARDIAGPMTDRQQFHWDLAYGVSPTAIAMASPGAIRGVGQRTMAGLLRGTPQAATEVAGPVAGRGRSVELNMPGRSTTPDPNVALQYGRSPNPVRWEPPVSNPENVSRITSDVPAADVRNVRPSEFAAVGDTMPAPGVRQPTTLREPGQEPVRLSQEPALSLPQSEMPQAEVFFPQRGEATLTSQPQTAEAIAAQREQLRRLEELRARRESATTPAARLLLARDLAGEATGSRAMRPLLPDELSRLSTLPDAPTMRALFPEDVAALEQLQQRSGALNTTYNQQGDMAQRIREAVRGTRGTITPEIRQQMDALDASYRGFTSGNTGFMQETANLPRTRTHVAAQDMILRDLEANSARTRVPLTEAVANAHPVAQNVGLRPDQFAHALRDPTIYRAAAARDPALEQMLRERLDVMQMAE